MTLYSINMTIPMVIISEPSNIIINKIIDLLPSITLITGGLWGVYKYIQEKKSQFLSKYSWKCIWTFIWGVSDNGIYEKTFN